MTKTEIIILTLTIIISVSCLCLFLDKLFKQKVKKEEPVELKVEPAKEVEEIETKPEEKPIKKSLEISPALQDELNEFKDYLKTRITPEIVPEEQKIKYSYNSPKINNNYQDYGTMPYDDYLLRRKKESSTKYEDLPPEVKMLLFTNFFDTKF